MNQAAKTSLITVLTETRAGSNSCSYVKHSPVQLPISLHFCTHTHTHADWLTCLTSNPTSCCKCSFVLPLRLSSCFTASHSAVSVSALHAQNMQGKKKRSEVKILRCRWVVDQLNRRQMTATYRTFLLWHWSQRCCSDKLQHKHCCWLYTRGWFKCSSFQFSSHLLSRSPGRTDRRLASPTSHIFSRTARLALPLSLNQLTDWSSAARRGATAHVRRHSYIILWGLFLPTWQLHCRHNDLQYFL